MVGLDVHQKRSGQGLSPPQPLHHNNQRTLQKGIHAMTIILKNSRGGVVHLRIDRRVVVPLVTLGLAILYKGLPL